MPIYRVSLVTEMFGQQSLNTRHYFSEGGTSQEIAEFWRDNILPGWLALISSEAEMKLLQVDELVNQSDTYIVDLAGNVGGGVTDPLPQFDAVGMYFPVETNVTRGGANRIMGVTEGQTVNGQLDPTWLGAWQALATALQVGIPVVGGAAFPVVIRDLDLRILINYIVAGTVTRLTTQNSRKAYTKGTVNLPSKPANVAKVITVLIQDPAVIVNALPQLGPLPPAQPNQVLFPRYEDKLGPEIINAV